MARVFDGDGEVDVEIRADQLKNVTDVVVVVDPGLRWPVRSKVSSVPCRIRTGQHRSLSRISDGSKGQRKGPTYVQH